MRIIIILTIGLALCAVDAYAKPRHRPVEEYWWLCPVDRSIPIRPEYSSVDTLTDNTEVRADSARVVDRGTTFFNGDVEFIRNNNSMLADELAYDKEEDTASIEGNAHIWGPSVLWQGERAHFDFEEHLSRLERGSYWLTGRQGRGRAELLRNNSAANVTRLNHVDYTTCPRQGETWKFSASKIKLDHDADRGYATNALLKVHGVPIFYIPYISFPLSDKRKSGLLSPSFSSSSKRGVDIKIPWYFNLAPNQDATFAPRIIGNRGQMLTGQYRYLGPESKSEFDFEYLPSDDLDQNKSRSSFAFKHQQYYAEHRGFVNALLQDASDARYFEDFGTSLSVTSQRFLDRRLETTYVDSNVWVYGLLQSYQNIDSSIPDAFGPYRRLPQIIAQTLFPEANLTPHFYAIGEYTYFDRDASVSGNRVNIEPTISLPFIKPWAIIRPALGVKYTQYLLTNQQNFDDNLTRAIPTLTVDSQFFLERRFRFFGERLLQTLEPRAYYALVPKEGQDEYPVFDTGLVDFQFLNLFRDNRFAGHDRVGDTNQLTLATTSRLFSLRSGRELIRASVGQIYYFQNREISLPGVPGLDSTVSELIGEIGTRLTSSLSTRATVQWDPETNQTNKSAISLRYAPHDGTVVNLAFRQRRPTTLATPPIQQTDISFRIPMTESWSLIGRWAYSLESEQALEVVGGMEYESCCWGARVFGRRFLRNVDGQFDNAMFMEVEFKGLAGYGRGAQSFLKRSIPGYEALF